MPLMLTFLVAAALLPSVAESIAMPTAYAQKVLDRNRHEAKQLEKILSENGIHKRKIVVAMMANAWHETHFDSSTSVMDTNGARSVGMFQLNDKGMGYGMTVAERQHLPTAMERMFERDYFWKWVDDCRSNYDQSAGDMAYNFAAKVLRCAKRHRSKRKATAELWA